MPRALTALLCLLGGSAALICALLIPAYWRAIDAAVLARAGANTQGLIERGLSLAHDYNIGSAQWLLTAAQKEGIADTEPLAQAVHTLANSDGTLVLWGSRELESLAVSAATSLPAENGTNDAARSLTAILVHAETRSRTLDALRRSQQPGVLAVLDFQSVTNTALFPPSQSASGQALDAALSLCGLLMSQNRFSPALSNAVVRLATEAIRGADSQRFEQFLMDLLSLGQRMNWGQLTEFISHVEDPETLRLLTSLVRQDSTGLPELFAAVSLSGNPSGVTRYLMEYSQSGLKDLRDSLQFGSGAVNELVHCGLRVHTSKLGRQLGRTAGFGFVRRLGEDWSLQMPLFALTVKWIFYLVSGFLLVAAIQRAAPPVPELERPLRVRGFPAARGILFALGFLLLVLLLSEPFLAQDTQRVEFPFRLRLPMAGGAAPAGVPSAHAPIMSQTNLLTLALFFVLQGLLYTASLVKLAEIRRQRVPARVKLKLLENEDHLFDAGLYLGFLGTIVSFIIFSLGVVKEFSLMVAYSSTSFGIIFVSIFKILHLRPARRRILMEADAGEKEPSGQGAPQAIAVHL